MTFGDLLIKAHRCVMIRHVAGLRSLGLEGELQTENIRRQKNNQFDVWIILDPFGSFVFFCTGFTCSPSELGDAL